MTTASTATPARRRPVWVTVAVSGAFGLFYAYVVWNAVTLLVAQASGPLGLNALGWAVLGFTIVFPIVAFGVAFAVGYRRPLGEFALVLLVGLAVVAVLWVNVLAYAYTYGAQLLG
ncbi:MULTISPECIES: bacitracin resistance protein [unclassified Microbacterium]|uniref:bacitracin resistance protein n=1 Tax=unclassified Microbacterium TaxID=2609290 RepID=UPI000F557040|nr:bacitracin resistance protein [Microbacterium sp. ABRD28]AZC14200.1 bacitracin resistance protein [Microbacterium sp. ABRD28]